MSDNDAKYRKLATEYAKVTWFFMKYNGNWKIKLLPSTAVALVVALTLSDSYKGEYSPMIKSPIR